MKSEEGVDTWFNRRLSLQKVVIAHLFQDRARRQVLHSGLVVPINVDLLLLLSRAHLQVSGPVVEQPEVKAAPSWWQMARDNLTHYPWCSAFVLEFRHRFPYWATFPFTALLSLSMCPGPLFRHFSVVMSHIPHKLSSLHFILVSSYSMQVITIVLSLQAVVLLLDKLVIQVFCWIFSFAHCNIAKYIFLCVCVFMNLRTSNA